METITIQCFNDTQTRAHQSAAAPYDMAEFNEYHSQTTMTMPFDLEIKINKSKYFTTIYKS